MHENLKPALAQAKAGFLFGNISALSARGFVFQFGVKLLAFLTGKVSAMLSIRKATSEDKDDLWKILEPVIRAGETYDFPRQTSRQDALTAWLAPDNQCFVACEGDRLLGTYVLHPNRKGGGAHVANCGYMTASDANGKGVARTMCAHSLEVARAQGFRAMQFNFVIASNHRAVKLWTDMGFETVGRVPEAFLHPVHGYTDALVMYRRL